jgi:hypothetical protein
MALGISTHLYEAAALAVAGVAGLVAVLLAEIWNYYYLLLSF